MDSEDKAMAVVAVAFFAMMAIGLIAMSAAKNACFEAAKTPEMIAECKK